jgi:hypothetical protein
MSARLRHQTGTGYGVEFGAKLHVGRPLRSCLSRNSSPSGVIDFGVLSPCVLTRSLSCMKALLLSCTKVFSRNARLYRWRDESQIRLISQAHSENRATLVIFQSIQELSLSFLQFDHEIVPT